MWIVIFTYVLVLINIVIYVLAVISFAQSSAGNSTGVYSTNSSANAFAYMGVVDLIFAWFFMFNSQWLQRRVFHQTLRENVWPHETLSLCALVGFVLHGVFFMANGHKQFSSILDKDMSGLLAWVIIIFMSILLFRIRYYWFHLLMIPFLLFSFIHSYVMIGLLTPMILISGFLYLNRPTTYQGQIISSQTTELCTILTVQSSGIDTRQYPMGSFFTVAIEEFDLKNKRDMYIVPYHLSNSRDVKGDNNPKKLSKHPHRLCLYIQANQGLSYEIHEQESAHITLLDKKTTLKQLQSGFQTKIDEINQFGFIKPDEQKQPHVESAVWSVSKQDHAKRKLEQRIKKIKKRLVTINRELHELKKVKLSTRNITLQGPFGGFLNLPHPLEKYRYIVIFAEQAGIIPLTIYLNNLLDTFHNDLDRITIWIHWMCPERTIVCDKYQKVATKNEIRYAQFQPNFINFKLSQTFPSDRFQLKCTLYLTHMKRQIRPKFVDAIPTTSTLPSGHRFQVPPNVSFVKNRGFNMKKILSDVHQDILDKELQKIDAPPIVDPVPMDDDNENSTNVDADDEKKDPEIVVSTTPVTPIITTDDDHSERKRALAILYCGDEDEGVDGAYETCVRESRALSDLFLDVHFHQEKFYIPLTFDN